ncbi:aminotransferase class-V family protein, partial [Vibrio parahaemolyticus V-223/04]
HKASCTSSWIYRHQISIFTFSQVTSFMRQQVLASYTAN